MKKSEIEMQKNVAFYQKSKCQSSPRQKSMKFSALKYLNHFAKAILYHKNDLHRFLTPDDLKWLYFIIEGQFQKKPHFRNNCVNRCHWGLESVYVSFLISLIFIF